MTMRWPTYAALTLALAGTIFAGVGDGLWLRKVPAKDRARTNPFAADPDAPSSWRSRAWLPAKSAPHKRGGLIIAALTI